MTNNLSRKDEDAALVAKVSLTRDQTAFAQLYDFYAPRILSFLIRLRMPRTLAEDVTQDVMATLWRKPHLYDASKSSLATWLYRVARNRRIDLARRERLQPSGDNFDPDRVEEGMGMDTSMDGALDAGEREQKLRQVLQTLPPEQLTLVRLAFYEALTHSQIAAQTKLPIGTVKSRLRLAFSRLRRALEAAGTDKFE
ncbi:MAG: sigma-70 family RNA polymerase sigma factor [Hyphomicrobiales bacterium]|nr:sigma-70 family RNA polymerase sigma factor [Hyphomicrobiales bacterium]MDE2114100.1 sigma-70 family RNA polymerase sigma factor [Hyphomicrobiales bacterium]